MKWAQNNGEKMNEASAKQLHGAVLMRMDPLQYEKARELILQSVEVLDELQLKPQSCIGFLFLGELYADVGRKKEAVETLKKAESAFREMGMEYYLRRTQSALAKL